jgi:hypothetical protein
MKYFEKKLFLTYLSRGSIYALLLLLPFSVFWPIGEPLALGIFPLYVTPGFYISDIAVAVGLVAGLATRRRWGPFELSGPLLGFSLLALLTTPWALAPKLAGYTALRWLIAFGVYLCFVQRTISLERMAQIFVAGLCIHVPVGAAQIFLEGPLGLPGELAREANRAQGLTFHSNVLGGYLAIGLLLLMPLLHKWSIRWAWWLLWLGLFLSFSRSAWLAVALMVPLVTAWTVLRYPEERRALAVTFLGAGVVLLVSSIVWNAPLAARLRSLTLLFDMTLTTTPALVSAPQIGTTPPPSLPTTPNTTTDMINILKQDTLFGRIRHVQMAIGTIAARPLRGIGAGNSPLMILDSGTLLRPELIHNVPFMLAAEVGVLGGGIWLSIWVAVVLFLIHYWPTTNTWAIVTLSAGLALAVIGWFDSYPWGLNSGRLLTAMVLGLIGRTLEAK